MFFKFKKLIKLENKRLVNDSLLEPL